MIVDAYIAAAFCLLLRVDIFGKLSSHMNKEEQKRKDLLINTFLPLFINGSACLASFFLIFTLTLCPSFLFNSLTLKIILIIAATYATLLVIWITHIIILLFVSLVLLQLKVKQFLNSNIAWLIM